MSDIIAYATEIDGVPEGVNEQFRAVYDQLQYMVEFQQMRLGITPPPRPQPRQMLYADGVYWNPAGYGAGLHYYDETLPDQGYDFDSLTFGNRGVIPAWGALLSEGFAINLEMRRVRAASGEQYFVYGVSGGRRFYVALTAQNQIRMVIEPTVTGGQAELDITHPNPLSQDVDYYVRAFHSGDVRGRAGIVINGDEYAVPYVAGAGFAGSLQYLMSSDTTAGAMKACEVYSISLRDLLSADSRHYPFEQLEGSTRIEDSEGGSSNLGTWDNALTAASLVSRNGAWVRFAETEKEQQVVNHAYYFQQLHQFGYIDGASDGDVIWPLGGSRPPLPTPGVVTVTSSSANDTSGGTGARTVRVQGVDANYDEIEEDFTLNGTTGVVGSLSFAWVNRMFVKEVGSSEWNEGNLTADIGGTTYAYVIATEGQTQQSMYMVPNPKTPGTTACFLDLEMCLAKNNAQAGYVVVDFVAQVPGEARRLALRRGLSTTGSSEINNPVQAPIPIPVPGTLLWAEIEEVSSNGFEVICDFDIIWLKQEEE